MLAIFKKLFSKTQDNETQKVEANEEQQLGRTFNKILTSKYFGLEDNSADKTLVEELKDKKIQQIKELELKPKFARYIYANEVVDNTVKKPIAIQVSFQKERYSRKRQMLHVSEMSFIVKAEDFDEFEKKLNINLTNDFKHLAPENTFNGIERRKEKRAS